MLWSLQQLSFVYCFEITGSIQVSSSSTGCKASLEIHWHQYLSGSVKHGEREREREKSLLFLQKLLEQLLHWEEDALCDPCLHSGDECVCTGSRTAMLLKLCLQIQSTHIISKG